MILGGILVQLPSKIGEVVGGGIYFAAGLRAVATDQIQPVAVAIGGALLVLASIGSRVYVGYRQMRREQASADLDARIDLEKRAAAANLNYDSLAGHVEQGAKEREFINSRLDRIESAVLRLVEACDSCNGETAEKVVACLQPTPDGLPGCHGLGPEAMRKEAS